MINSEQQVRHLVIAEINASNRLISEVAEEYGLSNKRVYEWIRLSKKASKRRISQRKQKLQTKVEQLTEELNRLSAAEPS